MLLFFVAARVDADTPEVASSSVNSGKIFGRVFQATDEIHFREQSFPIPKLQKKCRKPFFGDFDGDVALDLIVGCEGGNLEIHRWEHGSFALRWELSIPDANFDTAALIPFERSSQVFFVALEKSIDEVIETVRLDEGTLSLRKFPISNVDLIPWTLVSMGERHSSRSPIRLVISSAPGMAYEFTNLNQLPESYSLNELGSEEVRPFAFLDRFGTGVPELIFRRAENLFAVRCPVPHDKYCPADFNLLTWAEIPSGAEPAQTVSGDFDGDGRDDLISYRGGVTGWHLILSAGETGIEMELSGMPTLSAASRVSAVDWQGDGVSEIAVFDADLKTVRIFERSNLVPQSGVSLVLDENTSVVTDEKGRYEVSAVQPGKHFLSLRDPKSKVYSRKAVEVVLRSGEARAENFLSYPPPEPYRAVTRSGETEGPYVCNGYVPMTVGSKWSTSIGFCPPDYAFVAVGDGERYPKHQSLHAGSCCRLPAKDILSDESILVRDFQCPDDHVATGYDNSSIPSQLRCTRLTSGYTLGPKTPADYWGYGYAYGTKKSATHRHEIPLAVRYAIGRDDYFRWTGDGCFGGSDGSLAVSGANKECKDIYFRALLKRNENGTKPTRVQIFPECVSDVDFFRAGSSCRVK